MKCTEALIEEFGSEKLYEMYTNEMNKKHRERGWHPYIITEASEYYEDESKTGFVLDVYAGDVIFECDTFDEALRFIVDNTSTPYL